jgi:cohesin loading factor subunit SCC2
LADALIESLLTLEENRGEDKEEFGRKLVATISTIGAIAEVSAQVVLRHVDTFIPYLKADNGIPPSLECKVVSEVCDMLYRVCRKMPKAELMNLAGGSLSQDLTNIATNFPSSALSSAVGTLCELGSHKALGNGNSFRKKALVLANSFYKYLVKSVTLTDDYSSSPKKVQNNVHRALSGLGFLCRGHDVDDEDLVWLGDKVGEPLEVVDEDITWDNMVENCYQIFSVYLTKSDIETKKCALRALAGIFISRPRVLLAMQQNGTLEAIMSPTSDPELQLQALRCWKEILLVEEARLESGDAKEKMDSNEKITLSKKISGDQDSDATLVGGVLTQHQKRLYAMTKDRDDRIRYACVDLLSHLLRQGLLNPFTTIPHLFGLQGDVEAPDTRALALKLLINEGEKRPDTLRQRICEGVKHAYKFQRLVHPEREPTASIAKADGKKTTFESIFGAIFMESIRRTKKQKQGLFLNLLGLFDSGEALESSKRQKGKAELPLLAFAAEVLAYLPYDTLNDPLFIIHYIQSVAAVHGAQLLDVIEKFLEEQGCPVDANDENTEEDFLEIAARVKPKNPVSAKEATPLRERKFDIVRFEQLCESASAFTLLLRLKAYLRKLYKLTETRCLEYTPNGQDRPFDKLSTSVSEMPQFDSRIAGFFRHEPADKDDPNEHDINKDNVILQYVEFRRLLRMEQTVGARIAESEDEGEEKEIETAEIVVDEEHNEDSDII